MLLRVSLQFFLSVILGWGSDFFGRLDETSRAIWIEYSIQDSWQYPLLSMGWYVHSAALIWRCSCRPIPISLLSSKRGFVVFRGNALHLREISLEVFSLPSIIFIILWIRSQGEFYILSDGIYFGCFVSYFIFLIWSPVLSCTEKLGWDGQYYPWYGVCDIGRHTVYVLLWYWNSFTDKTPEIDIPWSNISLACWWCWGTGYVW